MYIFFCVCVCVCVCIYIYIYIYTHDVMIIVVRNRHGDHSSKPVQGALHNNTFGKGIHPVILSPIIGQ